METKCSSKDIQDVFKFIAAGYMCGVIEKENYDFNLNKSEQRLLKLVAQGMDNKEIANYLYITSEKATKKIEEIFTKMRNKEKILC